MNPFKQYRIKWGLTVEELASRAGTTKETLLTLEAGRYARPPEWAYEYYQKCGANYLELEEGYADFIVLQRERAGKLLGELTWVGPEAGNPFTYWRNSRNLTMHDVANRLCLSKTVIRNFEMVPPTQRCVPKPLIRALQDAGYRKSDTNHLETLYFNYLRSLREYKEYTNSV